MIIKQIYISEKIVSNSYGNFKNNNINTKKNN